MTKFIKLITFFLVAGLTPSISSAQGDEYAEKYRAGIDAYLSGDLADAQELFIESYHMRPNPLTAYYVAITSYSSVITLSPHHWAKPS
jgi:hypothetical protein